MAAASHDDDSDFREDSERRYALAQAKQASSTAGIKRLRSLAEQRASKAIQRELAAAGTHLAAYPQLNAEVVGLCRQIRQSGNDECDAVPPVVQELQAVLIKHARVVEDNMSLGALAIRQLVDLKARMRLEDELMANVAEDIPVL
jgi:hypothetical protein